MKKVFLFTASVLMMLQACDKKTEPVRQEMRFNIVFPSTKATASAFESGDDISLYAVAWDGETQYPLQIGGNFLNNERLSFNGTTWTASQALYWGSQPCDFYALYPYQTSVGSVDNYSFTLSTDQNDGGYEHSDLMYASVEKVAVNSPVNFTFRHLMSKLVIVLAKGESFEGDIPNDVVAHVYNTVSSCQVNWAKGSVEKNPFDTRPTLTMKKITNERFEAVIIPQNIEKTTPLIELTMGGIAYLLNYSLSFRPGYVHTVTLTLNTSPNQEQIEISIDPESGNWN